MKYNFEKVQEWLGVLALIFLGLLIFTDSNFFLYTMHGYTLPHSFIYPEILTGLIILTLILSFINKKINLIRTDYLDSEKKINITMYKNGKNKFRIHIGFNHWITFKILINKYAPALQIARHRIQIIEKIFQILKESKCDEIEITSHLINDKTMKMLEFKSHHHGATITVHERKEPSAIQKLLFAAVYKKTLPCANKIILHI